MSRHPLAPRLVTWWRSMVRRISKVGAGLSERTKAPVQFNNSTTGELINFFDQCNTAFARPWRWQADMIAAVRDEYKNVNEAASSIHADLSAYNEYYRERVTEARYVKEITTLASHVEQAIQKGDNWLAVEDGMRMGELFSEMRLKFGTSWERHALAGQKSADGSASTRIASDEDRFAAVLAALTERQKGQRDAIRIAAQRHPHLGSEGTLKTAYYKLKGVQGRD